MAKARSSLAHPVKAPVLSLLWLKLMLCCRFDPWPRNFHVYSQKKKKKKKKKKREREREREREKEEEEEEVGNAFSSSPSNVMLAVVLFILLDAYYSYLSYVEIVSFCS